MEGRETDDSFSLTSNHLDRQLEDFFSKSQPYDLFHSDPDLSRDLGDDFMLLGKELSGKVPSEDSQLYDPLEKSLANKQSQFVSGNGQQEESRRRSSRKKLFSDSEDGNSAYSVSSVGERSSSRIFETDYSEILDSFSLANKPINVNSIPLINDGQRELTPDSYFRSRSSKLGKLSSELASSDRPNFGDTVKSYHQLDSIRESPVKVPFMSTPQNKNIMASTLVPPQTPLDFTPGKTALDSPSLDILRKKFDKNQRVSRNGSDTSSGYNTDIPKFSEDSYSSINMPSPISRVRRSTTSNSAKEPVSSNGISGVSFSPDIVKFYECPGGWTTYSSLTILNSSNQTIQIQAVIRNSNSTSVFKLSNSIINLDAYSTTSVPIEFFTSLNSNQIVEGYLVLNQLKPNVMQNIGSIKLEATTVASFIEFPPPSTLEKLLEFNYFSTEETFIKREIELKNTTSSMITISTSVQGDEDVFGVYPKELIIEPKGTSKLYVLYDASSKPSRNSMYKRAQIILKDESNKRVKTLELHSEFISQPPSLPKQQYRDTIPRTNNNHHQSSHPVVHKPVIAESSQRTRAPVTHNRIAFRIEPEDVLDFGCTPYLAPVTRLVTIYNDSHSSVSYRLSLNPEDGYYFINNNQLLSDLEVQISAYQATQIPIQFKAIDFQMVSGIQRYTSRLVVFPIEEPNLVKYSSLVVLVGFTRLQVPKEAQELFFDTVNNTQYRLSLRNSGSLPLELQLVTSDPSFQVEPNELTIEPGFIREAVLLFKPSISSASQVSAFLLLKGIGSTYRLSLHGTSLGFAPSRTQIQNNEHHIFHTPTTLHHASPSKIIPDLYVSPPPPMPQFQQHQPQQQQESPWPNTPVSYARAIVNSDPILLCDRALIDWGTVDIGEKSVKSVTLKNNSMNWTTVALRTLHIEDSFKLLGDKVVSIGPNQQVTVEINFSPPTVQAFKSGLVIQIQETSERYKIPLIGYGGTSRIQMVKPSSHIIDMGICEEGVPKSFQFSMRNVGNRMSFVKAIVRFGQDRFHMNPSSVTIKPGAVQEFNVIYSPMKGDSSDVTWMSPHVVIELFSTDELLRRKLLRIKQRESIKYSLFDRFAGPFVGEQLFEEKELEDVDNIQRDVLLDIELFDSKLACLPLTLYGSVIIPKAVISNNNTSRSTLPTVPPKINLNHNSNNNNNTTVMYGTKQLSIIPKSLILFVDSLNDRVSNTKFQLINPSTLQVHYSVVLPDTSLAVLPSRGVISPYSEIELSVSLNDTKNMSVMPTWSQSFLIHYKYHENSPAQQDLVHIRIQKRGTESASYNKGNLALQINPNIIFPPTKIGERSQIQFPITNMSNNPQEWKLISSTPPYLRFNSDDVEPDMQPNTIFAFSLTSGTIPKRAEFDLSAYFEPNSVGVYTQYWTLYNTSTDASMQITIRGTGTPHKEHNNNNVNILKTFKKYPASLFCKEQTLIFPKTFLNCITTQKLCICNGTKQPIKVKVHVDPPFIVRHKEFELAPHSFKLLPCKFLPNKRGVIQSTITLNSEDNLHKTTAQLVGEGE